MRNVLDRSYRATIAEFVHDARVERDVPIPIWITRATNGMIVQVHFRDARACLDGVERVPVPGQDFPRRLVCSDRCNAFSISGSAAFKSSISVSTTATFCIASDVIGSSSPSLAL